MLKVIISVSFRPASISVSGQHGTGINAEAENGGKFSRPAGMTIAGTGATGISIESEGAIKGVQAINRGELLVENGGTGMKASGKNALF